MHTFAFRFSYFTKGGAGGGGEKTGEGVGKKKQHSIHSTFYKNETNKNTKQNQNNKDHKLHVRYEIKSIMNKEQNLG